MALIPTHELKNILNVFASISDSSAADSNSVTPDSQIEPFPFFNLPELVIQKIIKEFVSVSDKMGALSHIPQFKSYLQLKSLWYPSTLKLFQLTSSFTSGWYLECTDSLALYYFFVNYFDLNVTIHYFNLKSKKLRYAVQGEKWQKKHSAVLQRLDIFFDYPTLCLVNENEIFVYRYEEKTNKHIYFWIFRPQKIVRWSKNNRHYRLRNNMCSMLSKEFCNTRRFTLILKDDYTVELQCRVSKDAISESFVTVLSPLIFQPCVEKCHPELNNKLWVCQSCKEGPNYIHTYYKETYIDVDKDVMSVVPVRYSFRN